MSRPIITLTTDFGTDSPYVAQMKGAILSINPDVNLVDISHAVPPQDIRHGAMVLADVTGLFPPGSIHVAVIDPGVGTGREIVYVKMADHHFIAPNNGVLSLVSKKEPPNMQIEITNAQFWRAEVSSTFHGRDIMGPVAAHLSLGIEPAELGEEIEKLNRISLPEVHLGENEIRGMIISFDSFGNLITDITSSMLEFALQSGSIRVQCGTHRVDDLVGTYGEGMPLSLVALIGSSGMLELAVVNGNAAQRLGVEVGEEIRVTW